MIGYKQAYEFSGSKVDYKTFCNICDDFNKEIISQIIEGKTFKMGFLLGTIQVIEKDRKYKKSKNGVIHTTRDWIASNKKRQEIIDKGGIPYKAIKDENGMIIGDNGGEKWFIYKTSESTVAFYWNKRAGKKNDEFAPLLYNIEVFTYKPLDDNNKKLSKYHVETGTNYRKNVVVYDL